MEELERKEMFNTHKKVKKKKERKKEPGIMMTQGGEWESIRMKES